MESIFLLCRFASGKDTNIMVQALNIVQTGSDHLWDRAGNRHVVFLGYELQVPGDFVLLILLAPSCTVLHAFLILKYASVLISEACLSLFIYLKNRRENFTYTQIFPYHLRSTSWEVFPYSIIKYFIMPIMGNPITQIIHSEMEKSTWRNMGNNHKTSHGCECNDINTFLISIIPYSWK